MDSKWREVGIADVVVARKDGIFKIIGTGLSHFMGATPVDRVIMHSTTQYRGQELDGAILESPTHLMTVAMLHTKLDNHDDFDGLLILNSVTPGEKWGDFGNPSGQEGPYIWTARYPFEENPKWIYVTNCQTPKRAAKGCTLAVECAITASRAFRDALSDSTKRERQ